MNRYERQVRLLLRAYPEGWRDERGEEMVGTILDLAGDDRRNVSARVAFDLLVGGWSERARRHLGAVGPLAAGCRLAVSIAVVVQLGVAVVWLRDWMLTGTPAVLAPLIGNASAITYGLALSGFGIGAIAWLGGFRRVARIAGTVAFTAWVLTVGVFHALSGTMGFGWYEIMVWTYLATLATLGLHQTPPTNRRLAGAAAIVVVLVAQTWSTGVTPMSNLVGTIQLAEQALAISLLDRGADTLHTALRAGWTLFALVGLALVRIDPRPAVAACWLLPFLALDHLYWGGPLGLTTGVLVGLTVVTIALVTNRSPDSDPGRDLRT